MCLMWTIFSSGVTRSDLQLWREIVALGHVLLTLMLWLLGTLSVSRNQELRNTWWNT